MQTDTTEKKKKKKKKKKYGKGKIKISSKKSLKFIVLSEEDLIRDYMHLSRLKVNESTKDWIEHRMYELREKSNQYERSVLGYMRSRNIRFIHQAPFILDGKIYFADFYLPEISEIIEIDGYSHYNEAQRKYDLQRDNAFGDFRMHTTRISNSIAMDKQKLDEIFSIILKKKK